MSPRSRYLALHSGYLSRAHSPAEVVRVFRKLVAFHPDPPTFDTLVGTGLSGALVVPHLARALRVKWVLVRKGGDASHSYLPVEGDLGRRWLFVDDITETGMTLSRCVVTLDQVCREYEHESRLVGTFFYESDRTAKLQHSGASWTGDRNRPFAVYHRDAVMEWEVGCKGCFIGCRGCDPKWRECVECGRRYTHMMSCSQFTWEASSVRSS